MSNRTRLAISAATASVTLALAAGTFAVGTTPVSSGVVESQSAAVQQTTSTALLSGNAPKAKVHNYKRLTKKAKKVANKVRNDWRAIKSIGGWRAGSRYSGDHPGGRAIDVMIPKWKKNSRLGWSIAKYFAKKKNAKKYKIHYVIFRQKIWTVQTPRWRKMGNRGGATANHFDHVHISVKR